MIPLTNRSRVMHKCVGKKQPPLVQIMACRLDSTYAIIWTNVVTMLIGPLKQISVKFKSNLNIFIQESTLGKLTPASDGSLSKNATPYFLAIEFLRTFSMCVIYDKSVLVALIMPWRIDRPEPKSVSWDIYCARCAHWPLGGALMTGGFPSQRAETRKMFPFDDVIMRRSCIDDMNMCDIILF